MNARRPTRLLGSPNELVLGAVAIVVAAVAVFISYNANSGLPFVPTYRVTVQVPDADELSKGDDVRIGGGRVGQVLRVTAAPAPAGGAPHARVDLALDARTGHLPLDTQVQIRPASILGAKYVAIVPGHSRRTLPQGGTLALAQARPVVEINDFLGTFDAPTRLAIRGSVGNLGDALAGRGEPLNAAIGSTAQLLGPLARVARTLAAPGTNLAGFIQGADAAGAALAPVAPVLGSLLGHLDTTLAALQAAGGSLGDTLAQLPPTEAQGTTTLRDALPVLSDATVLSQGLRAGSALLPAAATRLDAAVREGTAVLAPSAGVPAVGSALVSTLHRLAGQAAPLSGDLRQLTPTVTTLDTMLSYLGPAQTVCNTAGVWARNIDSSLSQGDANGGWFRGLMLFNQPGLMQAPAPESDLHTNPYPHEGASECEAGNEPYLSGRQIGNPAGNQSTQVDQTAPPPSATALAARAGLLDPTPGAPR